MRNGEVWTFLFIVGLLAFSWPLPAMFMANISAYLFAAWALFIAAIYLFSRGAQNDGEGG